MKDTPQLTQLLADDIELIEQTITAEPPSSQKRLLLQSIDEVLSKRAQGEDAAKLLAIAQILLSGSYHFFDETEAIRLFKAFARLAAKETATEIKDSALTVTSLVLNRAREQVCKEADAIAPLLKEVGRNLTSAKQKALLLAIENKVEASRLRSQRAPQFKMPDLDVARAANNVKGDLAGDWYRDPWGWPEVDWLGQHKPKLVRERLSVDASDWTLPFDVVKSGGGVRPAMIINPLDRVAFQALVDDLSIEAAVDVPPWAHGWRLSRIRPQKGVYESNYSEWERFSRRVTTFCKKSKFTAHLDIRSFFATVDTSRLLSQLGRNYRKGGVIDRLEAYFQTWHKHQNGAGIPQRSLASSVLAHAVLRPLDVYISRMSASANVIASRWMDDIWLHGENEDLLRMCIKEIESLLAETGLSLNAVKTEVFPSEQADKIVQLVDVYEEDDDQDISLSLEDLAVEPSFQISKKVGRLLKYKNFASLNEIPEDRWQEFDHLARPLAKGFRVSGNWKRFIETYITFVNTHVSAGNLSVVSWGEMFPNTPEGAMEKVDVLFSKIVVDGSQRLLTPLAAQRLVAWSSIFGTGSLDNFDFGRKDTNPDPFKLRAIVFAALRVPALKDKCVRAASQADKLSAEFLKDSSFDAPQLSAKFESE